MQREELESLLSDCKTVNRFIERTDGRVFRVFGFAYNGLLAQLCYFKEGKLWLRVLQIVDYDEVKQVLPLYARLQPDDKGYATYDSSIEPTPKGKRKAKRPRYFLAQLAARMANCTPQHVTRTIRVYDDSLTIKDVANATQRHANGLGWTVDELTQDNTSDDRRVRYPVLLTIN